MIGKLTVAVFALAASACSANADGSLGGTGSGGSMTSSGGAGDSTSSGGSGATAGVGSATGGTSSGSGGLGSAGIGAGPGSGGSGGGTANVGPCGATGLFACDEFEAAALDTTRWNQIGDPTRYATIDATNFHSGAHSLFFGNIDNRGSFVAPASGMPADNNRFYVRAYVRFAKAMADMGGHVGFIVGATAPENGIEVRIGASKNFQSGIEMLDVNFIGNGQEQTQFSNGDYTGGQGTNNPGVTLDANRWYCIEGLFDGQASEVRVWIDSAEISKLHITDWGVGRTNWAPTYNVGKVGGQKFSGDTGQIWYDDVAFGTQQIGCN